MTRGQSFLKSCHSDPSVKGKSACVRKADLGISCLRVGRMRFVADQMLYEVKRSASMEDMQKYEPSASEEDDDHDEDGWRWGKNTCSCYVNNYAISHDVLLERKEGGVARRSAMDARFPYVSNVITENMDVKKVVPSRLSESSNVFTCFAAIFIHLIVFQVRFTFRLFNSLMQICCHSIFALNMNHRFSRSNVKESETNTRLWSEIISVNHRISSVKQAISRGVKKMAFGFVAAIHAVVVLIILFVTAFTISSVAVHSVAYEPMNMSSELYFDYTMSPPVASIKFPNSKMYSTAGSIILRKLPFPTRKYHATIFLTLPESEFNKKLGIFQVTGELVSLKGQVLMNKSQPCMLRYRSTIVQHTRSMLMAIPLLVGLSSETQTLALRLLEWQEERRFPSAAVRVVLAPRAGRNVAKGLPEIYKAEIHLFSDIPWWLSIIGWKWTLCVWLGLMLFMAEVIAMLFWCRWLLLPDFSSLSANCIKVLQLQQKPHAGKQV